MFGGLWRWLWWSAGGVLPQTHGGTYRRHAAALARTYRRGEPDLARVVCRSPATLARTWSYRAVPTEIHKQTLVKAVSDDRLFLFDLSMSPEIVAGDTIASAAVSGGTGLTFGAPAATTAALDGIAAGAAVQMVISGGTAGAAYTFAVQVTFASGRDLVIPARLVVAADY